MSHVTQSKASPVHGDSVAADIPLSAIATLSRDEFAALFPAASSALQGMAQAVLKSEAAS